MNNALVRIWRSWFSFTRRDWEKSRKT